MSLNDTIAQLYTELGRARAGQFASLGQMGQQISQSFSPEHQAERDMLHARAGLARAELQGVQDTQRANQVVDQALQPVQPQGPQEPGAAPMQPSHPYLDDDGLIDPKKVTGLLAANGLGHMAPDILKGIDAQNDAITKHQQLQQSVAKQNAITFGTVANTTLKLMDAGIPFDQAATHAGASLLATGVLKPEQLQAQIQQWSQLPPDQQRAALSLSIAQAAQLAPTKTLSEGGKEVDIFGNTVASNPKPTPLPTRASLAASAAAGDPNAKTALDLLKPPQTPEASQIKDVLLDNKPAVLTWEPKTKQWLDAANHPIDNPAERLKPIPPAAMQTAAAAGAATLNLPPWALDASRPSGAEGNVMHPTLRMTPNGLFQDAQTVISTGQYPQMARGNDPASQAKRAAIDSKVGAIAADAGMDVPTLRAFYQANKASLGQQQKMYDSVQAFMATADRNVDQLEQTLKKVPDVGSPIFNKPLRAFEKQVAGDPNMSQVATYLQSVQNEYARIIAQPNLSGQLTDSARHEAEQLLDPNATVPQMLASIRALKTEGTNRLVSLGEQIQRTQQRLQNRTTPAATPEAGAPKDGEQRAIPSIPGGVAEYRNGKWIRVK
jgi:hypothetical protein